MELVVLGTGGGWPRPGGAACGYLVAQDGYRLWVDAGSGTLANLLRHAGLLEVDAVAISHRHFDHFLDLYPFWLARHWGSDEAPRIPVFCPPGFPEHARRIEQDLDKSFEFRIVEPGAEFDAGPIRVRTARMRHPVPTLGMRLEVAGAALAYSADTAPCDEWVDLARGADLVLSEATWTGTRGDLPMIHMMAREAGSQAGEAGARRLLLTHIWPSADRAVALAEAGEGRGGGPVELAEEGMVVSL